MSEGSLFTDCHCMLGIECHACRTGHTEPSLNERLASLGLTKRKANPFGQYDIMRGDEVVLAAATAGDVWRWLKQGGSDHLPIRLRRHDRPCLTPCDIAPTPDTPEPSRGHMVHVALPLGLQATSRAFTVPPAVVAGSAGLKPGRAVSGPSFGAS